MRATFILFPFLLPQLAFAQPSKSGEAVHALYATKAEAEKAAKSFHCIGAHPMGELWMPCARHGEVHGVSH